MKNWRSLLKRAIPDKDLLRIPDRVHSPDAFRRLLEVERMRSDRSGQPFCLVTLEVGTCRHNMEAMNSLFDRIDSKIRATDHVGLMDRTKFAIVLWNTDQDGAEIFASGFIKHLEPDCSPAVEIYRYPDFDQNSDLGDKIETGLTEKAPAQPAQSKSVATSTGTAYTETLHHTMAVEVSQPEAKTTSEFEAIEDRLKQVDRLVETALQDKSVQDLQPIPVRPLSRLYVRGIPLWKRTLDIAGAGFGLLVLSPLLVGAGIAVKLTSPGPILFFQERTGRGGCRFRMAKFRSMVVDAEAQKKQLIALNEQDGPAFKMEGDPRVTRVGRILRALSIDELPQLWNVLKGDMTLVGPRPLPCSEADACNSWHRRRLDVTPGLTCIWQIKDRRNKIAFDDWIRMDLSYINRRSLSQDVLLILQTIRMVLQRKGI